MVVTIALAEATVLLANAGKTASLAPLVDGVDDPVDPGITANRLVVGVNEDNLVVLVHTVLVDPVRVKHTQVAAATSDTLLGGAPEATLELEVVDTLANGLAVGGTLRHRLFPVSAAHAHTVDQVALLCFVAQAASLVRARGARGAVDDVELTVLPAADTEEEAEDITLLLFVELANVLVRAHFAAYRRS